MSNVAAIKEQIILEVRMGLLRMRNIPRPDERAKLLQLLENSLEIQLNELISEASLEGFIQGQENILEAMG
jgi:hypothetical protein